MNFLIAQPALFTTQQDQVTRWLSVIKSKQIVINVVVLVRSPVRVRLLRWEPLTATVWTQVTCDADFRGSDKGCQMVYFLNQIFQFG
jgi:hypothetical protein